MLIHYCELKTMLYSNFHIFYLISFLFVPGSCPELHTLLLWQFLRISLFLLLTVTSNNSGQEFGTVFFSWLGWGFRVEDTEVKCHSSHIMPGHILPRWLSLLMAIDCHWRWCESRANLLEAWGWALPPESRVSASITRSSSAWDSCLFSSIF